MELTTAEQAKLEQLRDTVFPGQTSIELPACSAVSRPRSGIPALLEKLAEEKIREEKDPDTRDTLF